MFPESSIESVPVAANRFTAADVAAILLERGWLEASGAEAPRHLGSPLASMEAWLAEAAALLGPQAADREALASLLSLIFQYHASAILQSAETHTVLAREGARKVIRELAHLVLEGREIDSDRFKEIVDALKGKVRFRGREFFHPIRLALAGRAGGGELDRVILLLDGAAKLPFRQPVKSSRQRILEFCAALD